MKLTLKQRFHDASPSFSRLLLDQLEGLRKVLRIDEARIVIERRLESSPPFRMSAHLVTPGPDVSAEAVDHTLRAVLHKLMTRLQNQITHRRLKQTQRFQSHLKKSALRSARNAT
jgi:ribosome-associated translation inhibitor RaiA